MHDLITFTFVIGLIYYIVLIFQVVIAGFKYDNEKKKIDKDYKYNHSVGLIGGMAAAIIPTIIKDSNPMLKEYVTKYNKLAKRFWISILIGIPAMIFLVTEINKIE